MVQLHSDCVRSLRCCFFVFVCVYDVDVGVVVGGGLGRRGGGVGGGGGGGGGGGEHANTE